MKKKCELNLYCKLQNIWLMINLRFLWEGNRMPESVFWLKYLIAPMHPSGIHLFRWCLRIYLDSNAWAVVGPRRMGRSHILLFGEYSNRETNVLQHKPVHIVLFALCAFVGCWETSSRTWMAETRQTAVKRFPLVSPSDVHFLFPHWTLRQFSH